MLLWLSDRFHTEAMSRFPAAGRPTKGMQRVAKKCRVAMVYLGCKRFGGVDSTDNSGKHL